MTDTKGLELEARVAELDEWQQDAIPVLHSQNAELAALKAQAQEPVATVTIQHFRQDPSMENVYFQLQVSLPQGTHKLYAAPVPAQPAVVMPERIKRPTRLDDDYRDGWDACLDEVARLNGGKPNE